MARLTEGGEKKGEEPKKKEDFEFSVGYETVTRSLGSGIEERHFTVYRVTPKKDAKKKMTFEMYRRKAGPDAPNIEILPGTYVPKPSKEEQKTSEIFADISYNGPERGDLVARGGTLKVELERRRRRGVVPLSFELEVAKSEDAKKSWRIEGVCKPRKKSEKKDDEEKKEGEKGEE